MKILFAGIIARYPFGGVTWCSLMYLLGLRALGHEVFYIEDTGECVYDPVQNTRSTDPALRHDLHPPGARAVRSGRSVGVRQLRRHLSRPERATEVRALLRRRRPLPEPVGRLLVLARRVRADSAARRSSIPIRRSRSWPSPRPSRGTSQFFQRFDHLFTFGANIGTPASPVPVGEFIWRKTWQPVTLDEWRTDRAARRSVHDAS